MTKPRMLNMKRASIKKKKRIILKISRFSNKIYPNKKAKLENQIKKKYNQKPQKSNCKTSWINLQKKIRL